jgi:hypothetical protein
MATREAVKAAQIDAKDIDAVIQIASTMLGVEYFTKGINIDDLVIAVMSPSDFKSVIG